MDDGVGVGGGVGVGVGAGAGLGDGVGAGAGVGVGVGVGAGEGVGVGAGDGLGERVVSLVVESEACVAGLPAKSLTSEVMVRVPSLREERSRPVTE